MEKNKVDLFLMLNSDCLPQESLPWVRQQLESLDESRESKLYTVQLKKPTAALILSLFAGGLGVDRFYIGQTGLGVGKLLTMGGCWIWAIVDLFLIMGATREQNLNKLYAIIA